MSAKVARMTEKYFSERRSLKMVYVLVDGRRGLRDVDEAVIHLLADLGVQSQILLTKMDKVRGKGIDAVINSVADQTGDLVFVDDQIIPTSSEKGLGVDDIRLSILKACGIK